MHCDHDQLHEYLAGTPDKAVIDAVDRHLLDCDRCWTAVTEDRTGRDLARATREVAPAALRDRVLLIARLGETPPRSRHRRPAVVVAAAAVVVLTLFLAGGPLSTGSGRNDPNEVIAAVLAVPADQTGPITIGDRIVDLQRRPLARGTAIVATSDQAFPMPQDAQALDGVDGAWSTTQDGLTIVCIDAPTPQLLIGPAPASELLSFRST